MFKTILGIETSCDETAVAILQKSNNRIRILSNIVASSASLQAKYGGIIPEQAAREQLASMLPVLKEALEQAKLTKDDIDAIAITYGPGLIGSLLVGVETAKVLASIWNKPLFPVNHLLGHFYANWIESSSDGKTVVPYFPCIGLLVSGGHTDLVLFKSHLKYEYLGGTRDDAAGECFDKCARLLGLPYPGGPEISKLAQKGTSNKYKLPSPMIDSDDFDFSFSGLKTAVANLVEKEKNIDLSSLALAIEEAITDVLAKKTIKAAKSRNISTIIIAGGVAANTKLIEKISKNYHGEVFSPPPHLCTDNGAMIASAAFFTKQAKDVLSVQADPNLSL